MNFNFTGDVILNGLDTKNPYLREGKAKNGKPYRTFSMAVASAKNNRAFLELFGMEQDEIKTVDSDGNKISISWGDRKDEDIVKSVAGFSKNIVALVDGERSEYIAALDTVDYLTSHIDDLKAGRVTVTGRSTLNVYQGKISRRFEIKNVYVAKEDAKSQLRVTAEFFFNKDSIDSVDWKATKKLNINGYTLDYIASEKKNMYVPFSIVLDCSKIDFENEDHVKRVKFKLKQLGCELVDDKIKCNLKNNKYYAINIIANYVNGAEETEFTVDMLTPTQREQYELGLKTLDSFRPAGSVYGDRVTEYKLVDYNLTGKYEDGIVTLDDTADEFEENIYVVAKEESVDDVVEKEAKKSTFEPEAPEDEDLFG